MSSVVNENNQGIIVNKRNLIIKGNTIININDYKSDKSISRDGKFRIKSDDKYYNFNIPVLNKIDDSVYDSLDNLVYTKKIQSFTVDENCYFAGGRGVNYSKDYISSSDNQFWFMIYLNKMGLPSSIRDKGKILCKYPNISLWTKKEVGINVAYPDLICVHLDLSFFENDSIPKDAEELKEYFRTHENKKFNIYYELARPEVEELKNETIILDENSQCIIIDEAYDGDKNLLKTYDIKDNLKLLNEINDTLFGEDRTYYSSEFGCSYSEVSSICSGSKGSNKIYIEDLYNLDFEVGQGIAIEDGCYVRKTELSWLCALIKEIDYENKYITINRKLQENVSNKKVEHDNFLNYIKISEFFIDKDSVDLKFEPGTYINHALRSGVDTLNVVLTEVGIKHIGDARSMINIQNKRFINIDFQGSVFKEIAKWQLKSDYNFGGSRCSVLPYTFIGLIGCDKVTIKNGTVIHDSENNCIYTGVRTAENMGDGFCVHGCKDIYLENLEAYGCESDGFALGGSVSNFYDDNPRGNLNITMKNCRAYYCGRQGLTFSAGADGVIDNCDFSYTGFCKDKITKCWWGNRNPGAGIDFEYESASDLTTGWEATSAIRRIRLTNSKLIANSYGVANGMTEGNFLMENCVLKGNSNGVFLIKTGNNAGFTMRENEDEGETYVYGSMQPITCIIRDCLIDYNGTPNKSTFGYFRRVIIDSCILRNFFYDYGGRQFTIINSDLQYTDGIKSHMQGYPRFPLIQNCTVRFRREFIDKWEASGKWAWSPIYGQFQDCIFYLEEPTADYTDSKSRNLIVDFGKNSTRNYVYPAKNYGFVSSNNNTIIKEKTIDWGNRECYEVYSKDDFFISRVYRENIILTENATITSNVKSNFIISPNFVIENNVHSRNTASICFRGNIIDHIITIPANRKNDFKKICIYFWSPKSFKFPDGSTKFTYVIPEEYNGEEIILEIKQDYFDELLVDIKLINVGKSIF